MSQNVTLKRGQHSKYLPFALNIKWLPWPDPKATGRKHETLYELVQLVKDVPKFHNIVTGISNKPYNCWLNAERFINKQESRADLPPIVFLAVMCGRRPKRTTANHSRIRRCG